VVASRRCASASVVVVKRVIVAFGAVCLIVVRVSRVQEGVNEFTDRTAAEYRQLLGYKKSYGFASRGTGLHPPSMSRAQQEAVLKSLPSSVDWRQKGAVTPVKNQVCWCSCVAVVLVVWMWPSSQCLTLFCVLCPGVWSAGQLWYVPVSAQALAHFHDWFCILCLSG
jgi:hypothetical protein